jgi:hypothetical protein
MQADAALGESFDINALPPGFAENPFPTFFQQVIPG